MTEAAFPPIVHTYTDVLHLLRDEGPLTPTQIADQTDRDRSNLRRDLPKLIAAAVLTCDDAIGQYAVTDHGLKWVAGQDVAEGRASVGGDPWTAPHDSFLPDPDNARRDWDSDDAKADLDALAADIAANGLLQNLVARLNDREDGPLSFGAEPAPGDFILVGGERRWRAIGLLIERGDWPADREIPFRLLDADQVGVRLAALAENLQRRNLNPIEEATAYQGLIDVGLNTGQIAERVTVTQRHVQYRLALLTLPEDAQRRMTLADGDPQRLSVSDARKLIQQAEARRKAVEKWEAELSAAQRLVLLEAYAAAGFYIWGRAEVDPAALVADVVAAELEHHGLIRPPAGRDTDDGRAYLRLEEAASAPIKALGGDDPSGYAAALRLELGLPEPEEGAFTTLWLNGPFDLPADIAAEVAAAQSAREDQIAANIAQREAEDAERAAARERGRLAADRAAELVAQVRSGAPYDFDQLAAVAAEAEAPLPWRVSATGGLIAANDNPIVHGGNALIADRGLARMRLLAFAINSAAGLATPEDDTPPEPEPDQDIHGDDPDAEDVDEAETEGDD